MDKVRQFQVLIAVVIIAATALVITMMLRPHHNLAGATTPAQCAEWGGTWTGPTTPSGWDALGGPFCR